MRFSAPRVGKRRAMSGILGSGRSSVQVVADVHRAHREPAVVLRAVRLLEHATGTAQHVPARSLPFSRYSSRMFLNVASVSGRSDAGWASHIGRIT